MGLLPDPKNSKHKTSPYQRKNGPPQLNILIQNDESNGAIIKQISSVYSSTNVFQLGLGQYSGLLLFQNLAPKLSLFGRHGHVTNISMFKPGLPDVFT